METPASRRDLLFQFRGTPPIGASISLALQHLVAMIVGCVTPPIIIAGAIGLSQADRVLLIQASLVMSAVCTLLQLFPIGGRFGSGLPVILGVSFAYLPSMQAIVAGGGGVSAIAGAMLVGGVVAVLVGIGVFRASGAMDWLTESVKWLVGLTGADAEWVGALPTALMKPLSGSGARGMMVDAMTTYGADSFVGRLSCIFQGSTDTTFYILAVYFGSVGISKTRHAVACGLLADLAGILAAIGIAYLFF